MTCDFESLACPMCGGELIYSEGTHDLCCVKNVSELCSLETGRGRNAADAAGSGRTLHEPGAEYGTTGRNNEMPCELSAGKAGEQAVEGFGNEHIDNPGLAENLHAGTNGYRADERDAGKRGDPHTKRAVFAEGACTESSKLQKNTPVCVFAVSFIESGKHGTLWSIRTVHGGTNYFALMRLIDKIEKRQRKGEPLAANVPNLPRKVERSKECKLAFRYNLEVEDLYSIKYSSETVNKLSMYYGLSERDIRHIQAVELGGE